MSTSRALGALLVAGIAFGSRAAADTAEFDCLVEPWQRITLAAAIEGVVDEVLVERGDRVSKGEVVARLESSVERAQVESARARAEAKGPIRSSEARLEYATVELERQQSLDEKDAVAQRDLDGAQSSKHVAEAELLAAREARILAELDLAQALAVLERRTLKSPVDGVVVERILSPGEYADPPEILELAQIDPLRVEVFAPLRLFGAVRAGSEAEVLTTQPVERTHRATVIVVDPVADPASETFRIRLELPNPEHSLPAGMQCKVRFDVPGEPAPADAAQPVTPADSRTR